jgi:polyprenyl-phospho-N-acetylgalactosaminyl synthase
MTSLAYRPCILIPTYNNGKTLRAVVEKAHPYLPHVIIVDDASEQPSRQIAEQIERDGLARVAWRDKNGGKGAAVKTGFRLAEELGYTHALQVDADGQHDLNDIPAFLEASREHPESLIVGQPKFDDKAPLKRLIGRVITNFWVKFETAGAFRYDALCGYRVYPLRSVSDLVCSSNRMDFDPEILVRLTWRGVQTRPISTRITYVDEQSGGVSHFRLIRDNLLISWLHFRLVLQMPYYLLSKPFRLDRG